MDGYQEELAKYPMKFDVGAKEAAQKGATNKKGKKGKVPVKVGPTTQGTAPPSPQMKEKDEVYSGIQSSDGLLLDPKGDKRDKRSKSKKKIAEEMKKDDEDD